jgi:acetyl esterase
MSADVLLSPEPLSGNRKPIDPALRQFLDEQYATQDGPVDTPEKARARLLNALRSRDTIPGLPNSVETDDIGIAPGIDGRLYRPAGLETPAPLLVYLHGGGWVAGSIETHDPFCRLLSEAGRTLILSVEYRRAPENRYPAALGDTLVALRWAFEHAENYEADPHRVSLGGDSAGGNLAAAAANRWATMPATVPERLDLRTLVLLFPVVDHPDAHHPSYTENGTGHGLEANTMRWYWQQYAAADASPDDPELAPLRIPQLPTLPPTLITTAEYDVLRDEGVRYAGRLRAAGVDVTHLHAPDMHHDFPVSPATVARFPQSIDMLQQIAGWLRAHQ